MTPAVIDGSGVCLVADGLCNASAMPTVTAGGVPAQAAFAGQVPGYPGVAQINLSIPQSAPTGSGVPVIVKFRRWNGDQQHPTIAVQSSKVSVGGVGWNCCDNP